MKLRSVSNGRQRGLSLVGFVFFIAIGALAAILALKIVPTVTEYLAVKKAIAKAATEGKSVQEVRTSFDRQREVNYVESISGKDLEITKSGDGFDVNVSYQKKIPLFGPASLVLDYVASTGNAPAKKTEP